MLACAHVLAMDAKNLLDVVDSIRVRYPDLVLPAHLQPQQPPSPTVQHFQQNLQPIAGNNCAIPSTSPQVIHSHTVTQTMTYQTQVQDNENQYQNSPNDCYQNAQSIARQQLQHSSPPTSLTHSYTGPPPPNNDTQIPPQQIYSNQQGIYDNEANNTPAPLKKPDSVSNANPNSSAPTPPVKLKPPPPVRAPTTGLVSKMRANFQPPSDSAGNKGGFKSNQNNDNSLNEPLKIVEDPNEIYSNTAGLQLPEPVSCQIVQENLMPNQQQKVVGTNLGK